MDKKLRHGAPGIAALLQVGLLLGAGPVAAAEYWLCAKAGTVGMPDGQNVPIWGYVSDSAGFAGNCAAPAALPGPALTVPPGDTTLTIHLRNDLTLEPTSIVIPGQTATMVPVKFTDGQGRQRVFSFTHEAAANGGMADYTWNDVRPGTYLYHSGSHAQVQVQMGLYGALTKNFADAPKQAYEGTAYDNEVTLLFSEIDPAQHAAIAGGTYGNVATPTACQDTNGLPLPMTSTLCYKPKYFLINGQPFQAGAAPLATLTQGQATLLRLINAGYRAYVPLLQGMHMKMVAEDGNRYQYRDATGTYPRDQYQYSTWLAALKTTDAIIVPATAGSYSIFDRRLNTVSGASQDGGIFGQLAVAAGAAADVAISKTDGLASISPGDPVTYTIVASNGNATAAAPIVTVTDVMPAALTGATWTCAATAGSSCPAGGSGNINAPVSLAAGGSATFTVSATVSGSASGTLANTASVTVAPLDPQAGNNSATDSTTIQPPPVSVVAYFSTAGNTVVPGVTGASDDADIYVYNSDGSFARVFDASTVGVPGGANVDAFVYNSPSDIYVSFTGNVTFATGTCTDCGGPVTNADIVRWNGTQWSLYFDGSDVGMTAGSENVNAFALLADGSVLVSTTGSAAVPGGVSAVQQDLLRCAPGTFGAATTCSSWGLYFDGSDVALAAASENLRYAKVMPNGDIQLRTTGAFQVNGLSGTTANVFSCNSPVTGANTSCGSFSNVLTLPTLPTGSMDAIYLP